MSSSASSTAFTSKAITDRSASHSSRRLTAALLIGQFVTMWGAFFILAPSINWPASLRLPPAEILPLISTKSTAVMLGYTSYLIHALLLLPIAALLPSALGMTEISGRMSLLFGGLAGFAKALGITRWIFLMPGLASSWLAPGTSDATREAIAVVYKAFNAYAGGVGEILGVGLLAGIWTLILSATLISAGKKLIGIAGIGAALLLLSTLPSVIGIESPILLTLSGIAWQFWTLALAISLLRRA
jgi:hypothetical protein